MSRQTLESWLLEAVSDTEKDPGHTEPGKEPDTKCYRIVMSHVNGTAKTEVHPVTFGSRIWTPAELAKLFRGKAESYAQDLDGDQLFMLYAFYGNNPEPQASHPYRVDEQRESGGINTHGPSDKGLIAHAMSQSATSVAQANRQSQFCFQALQGMTQMLADQNVALRKENNEVMAVFKQMIIEKAADDNAARMAQLSYERSTGERKKWLGFLPALVNTVIGREIFPQSTADTALIEMIAEKLGEEDIAKVAGVVPPELMGPLMARAGEYMAKKRKEKEEAEKINNLLPAATPEEDAMGGIQ